MWWDAQARWLAAQGRPEAAEAVATAVGLHRGALDGLALAELRQAVDPSLWPEHSQE
jgi:hypothetical protein